MCRECAADVQTTMRVLEVVDDTEPITPLSGLTGAEVDRIRSGDPERLKGPLIADVVVACHLPRRELLATLENSRAAGLPCVVTGGIRLDLPDTDPASSAFAALRQGLVVVATPHDAEHLAARGIPAERVFVIGPSVDVDRSTGSQDETRTRFGLHPGRAAGIVGGSGELAAAAMQHVLRRLPDAQFLQRPSLDGEERPAFYAAVDVVVCLREFDPATVVEAWGAGRPVIAWRRGSIPSIVDEGLDALLVEYGQPSALGVAIAELLENHPRAAQMGQAGLSKVRTRYTQPRIAEQYLQVLRVAIASR